MKRRLRLVRKILEYLEARKSADDCRPPECAHYTVAEVCYHAKLCHQAGYIERFREVESGDGARRSMVCMLGPLTWRGHEALAELRENPPED